jgi:putative Holliday junction resolvase
LPHVTTTPSSAAFPRPLARYLAVDYGERRVGLAVSDPEGLIASPAGFIARRLGKRPPVAEILRQAEALGARGFVLGLPLDDQGEETLRSAEVRVIAAEIEKRTSLPVRLVDERYTTAAALRSIREMGGSTRDRKGDVDALAATLLLRHAMDIAAHEAATARAAASEGDPRDGAPVRSDAW